MGGALMCAFPETIQILMDYGKLGVALSEATPGATFDEAVQDIIDGNCGAGTRVIAVYRTGLGIETADISEDICQALMGRGEHVNDFSSVAKQFLKDNGYDDFVNELDSYDPDEMRDRRIERMRIGLI
jgi:hypothetical protein